jgi:hypothetical protein
MNACAGAVKTLPAARPASPLFRPGGAARSGADVAPGFAVTIRSRIRL